MEEEEAPLVPENYNEAYQEVKRKKHAFREDHAMKKNRTAYSKNKSMAKMKEVFEEKGIDPSLVEERMRNRSRSRSLIAIKAKKNQMMDEEE